MRNIIIGLVGLVIVLSGCEGYMLSGSKKTMFTETVSGSTFKVTFCGNAYMSQKEAEKYAMQRACELALHNGFNYFVVLEKDDNSEACALRDSPPSSYSGDEEGTLKRGNPSASYGAETMLRPNLALKISCYKSNPPEGAIDARKYLDENFPGLKL